MRLGIGRNGSAIEGGWCYPLGRWDGIRMRKIRGEDGVPTM
jgi:hypothetical protein